MRDFSIQKRTPCASPGNIYFTRNQFSMLCSIIFIFTIYFCLFILFLVVTPELKLYKLINLSKHCTTLHNLGFQVLTSHHLNLFSKKNLLSPMPNWTTSCTIILHELLKLSSCALAVMFLLNLES